MKLTKAKLRKIIKEELLNEKGGVSLKDIESIEDAWENTLESAAESDLIMSEKDFERVVTNATKLFNKALGLLSKIH